MRVLIIHNQAWAHYKSVLFQEIDRELPGRIISGSELCWSPTSRFMSKAGPLWTNDETGSLRVSASSFV